MAAFGIAQVRSDEGLKKDRNIGEEKGRTDARYEANILSIEFWLAGQQVHSESLGCVKHSVECFEIYLSRKSQ